jgi:site-specific recombinase XerD
MTWIETVDEFARFLRADEKSPLTIRNYKRELRAFETWYQSAYQDAPVLLELQADELREYKEALRIRKLKPASVNLAIASLRSLLKWATDRKMLKEPPKPPKIVRQVRKRPRWLTRVQERRLLKVVRHGIGRAPDPHHLGLVELLLVFGLRISELANLEWSDVTMSPKSAELRVRHGKGAKERTLPFVGNQRARNAFLLLEWKEWGRDKDRRILQGQRGPLSASGVKQLLTPYGEPAGIDKFSAHVLRHTCARRMHENGAPIQVISRWLGHESLDTTMLYTLPSEEDLAKAAGGSDPGWDDEE